MNEDWRDSVSLPGIMVSSCGRIKRGDKTSFGTMRPNGYLQTSVSINGVNKFMLIHRLVAEAFIGVSSLGVNHKNGIKSDNRVENLEYCTQAENVRHAISIGRTPKLYDRRAHRSSKKKLSWEIVNEIRRSEKTTADLAREFGVYHSAIARVRSGETWKKED